MVLCSPVFDGMFDFCSMYTGASLEGAMKLNHNVSVILSLYPENYPEWVKVFHVRISTLLSILLDSIQTVFFKISKDSARFDLKSAILVHFN